VSVREINGPRWLESFAEEHLHGFERAHDRGLVIDRATSPDEPVDDSAAEGILLPFLLCAGLDWYDVQVSDQQDRFEGGVAPLPGV
jgi:hypothetical protein